MGITADDGRPDRLLAEVLDDLARAGIGHALVRAPSIDGRGQLEADLLVRPTDRPAAEDRLAAHGFARRPSWGRRPHRFHLRPVAEVASAADVRWLKIDLVTDLRFGPWHELAVPLDVGELLTSDRVDVHRLAPADELLAQLLHGLLDGKGLGERGQARATTLLPTVDAPGPLAAAVTTDDGPWPTWSAVTAAVDAQDWPTIEAMATPLRRRLASGGVGGVAVRRLANQIGRHSVKVLTAVAGRGAVVALVGPDGTGKTTLAAGVAEVMDVPARVLYGGTYRSGTRHSSLPGVATITVASRLVATRIQLGWHRTRGRLVVLDRHPMEATLGRPGTTSFRARARRRTLATILPRPDLLIGLDAPAVLLHERRPEHAVAQLEDDRLRHLALVARTPGAAVVDASAPAAEVRDRTVELVWTRIMAPGAPASALVVGAVA